jgi:hypothetical protein
VAYCDHKDVQKKLQLIEISEDSRPTIIIVTGFTDEVSADMDAKMQSAGINLPITNTDKLLILKSIAVNGVKAEIFRSVNNQIEEAEQSQKLYDDAMKNIINNPSIIEDTTTVSQGPGYSVQSATTVRFKRGETQW